MMGMIKEFTPAVVIAVVIVSGAFAWAVKQIYDFLNTEFVRKIECTKCINATKQEIFADSQKKYQEVMDKIDQSNTKWFNEVKELRNDALNNTKLLTRIDTKLEVYYPDKH